MDQSLFEQLGGNGQVSDLIDKFYYKALYDQTLRGFFLKADMKRVRLEQKTYFAALFGCPFTEYTGRNLIDVHRNLGITHFQFDNFLIHLRTILIDMNKSQQLIELILNRVNSQRHLIVFN